MKDVAVLGTGAFPAACTSVRTEGDDNLSASFLDSDT